jgi:hypothetical protein
MGRQPTWHNIAALQPEFVQWSLPHTARCPMVSARREDYEFTAYLASPIDGMGAP